MVLSKANDRGERNPHHEELTPVFKQIMIDRPTTPPAPSSAAEAALLAARFAGRDHPTAGNAPQSNSYRTPAYYQRDPGRD